MNEQIKYYKVLNKHNCTKDGSTFDYTPYINSGEWLPIIDDISLCNKGYHLTQYWNMFFTDKSNKIYEVEFKDGILEENAVGVVDKIVCKTFRFVKEFKPVFRDKENTGNWNAGYLNTGDRNTGDWNTGNWNTGYFNTGDWNTGDWNTGDWNTGHRNTGDSNTGNRNTGNSNTGNSNTGNSNTGNWNAGYLNTGDRNTGDWNTINYSTGSLNTIQPKYTEIFNHKILRSRYNKIVFPSWFYFEILTNDKDLHKSWKKSFNNANKDDIAKTLKLPYFNYKVFEKITGITKKDFDKRIKVRL